MALYEFICLNCKKKFTKLVSSTVKNATMPKHCPFCNSKKIKKAISKFLFKKSLEEKLDDLADPSKLGDLNNPKAVKSWAKKVGSAMGEDLGEDFDKEVEEEMENTDKNKEQD